jgi:hypothetical protein
VRLPLVRTNRGPVSLVPIYEIDDGFDSFRFQNQLRCGACLSADQYAGGEAGKFS